MYRVVVVILSKDTEVLRSAYVIVIKTDLTCLRHSKATFNKLNLVKVRQLWSIWNAVLLGHVRDIDSHDIICRSVKLLMPFQIIVLLFLLLCLVNLCVVLCSESLVLFKVISVLLNFIICNGDVLNEHLDVEANVEEFHIGYTTNIVVPLIVNPWEQCTGGRSVLILFKLFNRGLRPLNISKLGII